MLKFLLLQTLLLTFTVLRGQTNYKGTETISFNIITGYQSFPPTGDIDQNLTANKFENLKVSPFTLGIELAVAGKKSVGKIQFRGTSIFVSHKVQQPTLQPASISFQY